MGRIKYPVVAKRRVALLGWDGILCNGSTIFEWTTYLHQRGMMSNDGMGRVAKAHNDFRKGRIDHLTMVDRATAGYAHGLVGRWESDIGRFARGFAESQEKAITWIAPELVGAIHDAGLTPVVITGSPSVAVTRLAKLLGIDQVHGLKPFALMGAFTGMLPHNTALPETKQQIVETLGRRIVLGVGSSVGDDPLLAAARIRLFVGEGPAPSLDGVIRVPQTPSEQARRVLANAIAGITRAGANQGAALNSG
jgi:phosphoserine phosphatase